MTDNRTTELREKLTERGVKWWPMCNNGYYEDRDTEFVANGKKHTAHEWGGGLAVYNLTPEQAIAATLGNERAMHGTLTAEQVREAAKSNSRQYESPVDDGVWIREYDWQAIADELNARAERTCHIIEYDEAPYPVCSECGAVQPDDYTVYFCWNCGAKVRDE